MTGRLVVAALIAGALIVGCTPKDWCVGYPPGTLMVSRDGAITACHETPERIDLRRNR